MLFGHLSFSVRKKSSIVANNHLYIFFYHALNDGYFCKDTINFSQTNFFEKKVKTKKEAQTNGFVCASLGLSLCEMLIYSLGTL